MVFSPGGAARALLAAVLLLCVNVATCDVLRCSQNGSFVVENGQLLSGTVVASGILANASCWWRLGSLGGLAELSNIVADNEPVGASLSVYGACVMSL